VARPTVARLPSLIRIARAPIAGYPAVALAVGATSWIVGTLQARTHIYDASLLYLLVVLAGAIIYGIGPAIFASVIAVVMFDWFLDPVGTLVPDGLDQLFSLALFLIVGIVASQLAAGQRRRAEEALAREREATALYAINSLIVSTTEPGQFVSEALGAIQHDLQIAGLVLLVPSGAGGFTVLASAGEVGPDTAAERRIAEAVFRGNADESGPPRGGVHARRSRTESSALPSPVTAAPGQLASIYVSARASDRPIGVLGFCRPSEATELTVRQHRFLNAVGQQFGIALDRARLQAEAAEAAALRQTEELKTAVLNSVTHDLRTPLAMIKASAGSLRLGDVVWTEDEKDSFVVSIERNADRLDGIVGNLLDLSRLDAGMVRPERQYYLLVALVDDVVNRLRPLLADHPITVDVPDELPPVPVDYVAIDRVLSNLIENAVRHTPAGTAIHVTASASADEIVVTVADNGPGIPPQVLPHVFERFYRGRKQRSDARSGTGLGLAVAQGLVAAHDGRIWVESGDSLGARFSFTLPLDPSSARARTR
jgi:two-component system, OmpR family, sensor histidine kinase KdpD